MKYFCRSGTFFLNRSGFYLNGRDTHQIVDGVEARDVEGQVETEAVAA